MTDPTVKGFTRSLCKVFSYAFSSRTLRIKATDTFFFESIL